MWPPTCIAQLNTTTHDRIVDLIWDLDDPGILPGSADRYVLGDEYLRSSMQGSFCCTLTSPRSTFNMPVASLCQEDIGQHVVMIAVTQKMTRVWAC